MRRLYSNPGQSGVAGIKDTARTCDWLTGLGGFYNRQFDDRFSDLFGLGLVLPPNRWQCAGSESDRSVVSYAAHLPDLRVHDLDP